MSSIFPRGDRWYISFRHQKRQHCFSLGIRCRMGKRKINEQIAVKMQAEIDLDLRRGKFPELLQKKGSAAPSLYEFFAEYTAWQRQQTTRFKPKTVEHYENSFAVIKRIITRDIGLDQIDERMISKQIQPYLFEHFSKHTCRGILGDMRAAYNVAAKWYDLPENPFSGMVNKVPPTVPEFYTREEIEIMRQYFANPALPQWQGDIVFLILNTGLRRFEAFDLEWKHVHLDMELIIITGKGDKHRIAALNDAAMAILRRRFADRDIANRVFYEVEKVDAFKSAFTRMKNRTGLTGNIHRLRKTYSTLFANSDGNLLALRENLGHESINTTMIYAALTQARLLESKNRVNIYR